MEASSIIAVAVFPRSAYRIRCYIKTLYSEELLVVDNRTFSLPRLHLLLDRYLMLLRTAIHHSL